jgi:two-component system, OmpR family, sensor kinase
VSLWLRDTGPGVPPEDQPRIFERFARGRDADPADGSGLGLAIVAAIAEGHAGRATVDSVAGGGATFTISFPCVRPQAPARLTQTGSGRGQA